MKSLGARLTLGYALSATATLAFLFVAGYHLLENRLIHGLDLLNAAEFQQIKAHLGTDYRALNSQIIEERIRETTEYASVLFYINIDSPQTNIAFYSRNLNGKPIPDVPGKRVYNAAVPDAGELRVAEFVLAPFDITIGTPMGQIRGVMQGYVEVCLALLAGMLVASVAIGRGLSHLVLRPVRLIRETAIRIGSDNLSERIPVADVRDEISELARLLNRMFDRLESSFNQIRRFTAEASHELKTPLSLVRLHAEKLLEDGDLSPAREEAVQIQLEELNRLNQIIEELLFLSRAEARTITINARMQSPEKFLESFRQDASALAEYNGKRFTLTHKGKGEVCFEEKWLRQVLLNLLTNALNASPPDGRIALKSLVTNHIWRVSMEDEGPGISPDQRELIFERFVRLNNRTNPDSNGSGLGLAICRSIVGLHRGVIFAEAGEGGTGLKVVFEIPADRNPGGTSTQNANGHPANGVWQASPTIPAAPKAPSGIAASDRQ